MVENGGFEPPCSFKSFTSIYGICFLCFTAIKQEHSFAVFESFLSKRLRFLNASIRCVGRSDYRSLRPSLSLLRQRVVTVCLQLLFNRFFTEPFDQL